MTDRIENQRPASTPTRVSGKKSPLTPVDESLETHSVRLQQLSAGERAAVREFSSRLKDDIEKVRAAPGLSAHQAGGATTEDGGERYTLQIPGPSGPVTASVRKKDGFFETLFEDDIVFEVTAEGHTFEVECAPALVGQSRAYITLILEELVKIPPHLRRAVETVRLTDERNPQDAYWAQQYNIPNFESAATAGNGEITIWGLTAQNAEGRMRHAMSHEVGHLVGEEVRESQQGFLESFFSTGERYPEEWPAAIEADNRPVDTGLKVGTDGRNYSESSPTEDFAEAFKLYVIARMEGAAAVRAFASQYPNRAKILDDIWNSKGGGRR